MKINKSGFYFLQDISEKEIFIENCEVVIFDKQNNHKNVSVGNNANVVYLTFLDKESDYNLHLETIGENSEVVMRAILHSANNSKIKAKFAGILKSSFSKIDCHIVSFVKDNGIIDLDGIIDIKSGIEKVEGFLKEENLFLGDKGIIRGLPILNVASNDVKAGHSCSMDRISEDRMFYLRSRGIEKKIGEKMILESYIENHFEKLKSFDEQEFENVLQSV